MLERLMLKLFFLRVCCFLTGSLDNFAARVFRSYQAATLFVAEDDTSIQNLLFQRSARPIQKFSLPELVSNFGRFARNFTFICTILVKIISE
jgi:hypothetical protein